MSTTIKNVIPQSFIISESFPNEEGIRSYFSQNKDNTFFTQLEEKNKTKVSSLEKTIEISGNVIEVLLSSDTKNNKEYLAQLKKVTNDSILDHAISTVAFLNVSNEVANKIISYGLHYQVSIKEFDNELRFWLTPQYMGNETTAKFYLDLFNGFAKLQDNLREKHNITDAREIKRLMPASYGVNALVTSGINKWKEIITKGTLLTEDQEVRYVLINLAKNFKNRHQSIFMNMMLEDSKGQKFGLDTLKSSDNAWLHYKVIFI